MRNALDSRFQIKFYIFLKLPIGKDISLVIILFMADDIKKTEVFLSVFTENFGITIIVLFFTFNKHLSFCLILSVY